MTDVVLDLETLGSAPGCVILSIGAAGLSSPAGGITSTFYQAINIQSCLDAGLVVDGSTLAWWAKQSDDARRVFNDPSALPLPDALDAWLYWLDSVNAVRLWGNGANFDQPVLNAALRACGKLSPIAFWNERCLRTLKAAVPGVATPEFTGTKHHAMDDALHEAVLLNRLQTALRQQQQQHPQEGGREA